MKSLVVILILSVLTFKINSRNIGQAIYETNANNEIIEDNDYKSEYYTDEKKDIEKEEIESSEPINKYIFLHPIDKLALDNILKDSEAQFQTSTSVTSIDDKKELEKNENESSELMKKYVYWLQQLGANKLGKDNILRDSEAQFQTSTSAISTDDKKELDKKENESSESINKYVNLLHDAQVNKLGKDYVLKDSLAQFQTSTSVTSTDDKKELDKKENESSESSEINFTLNLPSFFIRLDGPEVKNEDSELSKPKTMTEFILYIFKNMEDQAKTLETNKETAKEEEFIPKDTNQAVEETTTENPFAYFSTEVEDNGLLYDRKHSKVLQLICNSCKGLHFNL